MKPTSATPTQQQQADASRYAHLLDWGTRVGLVTLVLSFAAYLFGILQPHVPLDQLPTLWNLPVSTYLQRTNTPTGWGWLALANKGDLVNHIGISLLMGCSVPALLQTEAGVPVHLATAHAGDAALFELQLVCEKAVITMEDGGLQWRLRRVVTARTSPVTACWTPVNGKKANI